MSDCRMTGNANEDLEKTIDLILSKVRNLPLNASTLADVVAISFHSGRVSAFSEAVVKGSR